MVVSELYLLIMKIFWESLQQHWIGFEDVQQDDLLNSEKMNEKFKNSGNYPFQLSLNNYDFDDLDMEINLDFTDKKVFVILK